MSTELSGIEEFLYTTLSEDEAIQSLVSGNVHSELSSNGVYPCVVFSELSATDINGSGAMRIGTTALYLVRGIAQADGFGDANSIAAAIDDAIQAQRLELTNGVVMSCIREQPFSSVDVDSGAKFYSRGGIYRILVH